MALRRERRLARRLPPHPPYFPAGVVLAAVAVTPQAQQAVIANSIPQTRTVPRVNGPTFSPVFDGAPQLRPIEGTPLEYVGLTPPNPIICVAVSALLMLRAGAPGSPRRRPAGRGLRGPLWRLGHGSSISCPAAPASPPRDLCHASTALSTAGGCLRGLHAGLPGHGGVARRRRRLRHCGYRQDRVVLARRGTPWPPPMVRMAQPVYNPAGWAWRSASPWARPPRR